MQKQIIDFKKYAIGKMKEYFNQGKHKHFIVSWYGSTVVKEKIRCVSYLQLCEYEIENKSDEYDWQSRIQIKPKENVIYITEDGKVRDYKDIFKEIINSEIERISICIKLVKKIDKGLFIAKIIDDYFVIDNLMSFIDVDVPYCLWDVVYLNNYEEITNASNFKYYYAKDKEEAEKIAMLLKMSK